MTLMTAFDRYCGAAATLDACLRYGDIIHGSPEWQAMEGEVNRLWQECQ